MRGSEGRRQPRSLLPPYVPEFVAQAHGSEGTGRHARARPQAARGAQPRRERSDRRGEHRTGEERGQRLHPCRAERAAATSPLKAMNERGRTGARTAALLLAERTRRAPSASQAAGLLIRAPGRRLASGCRASTTCSAADVKISTPGASRHAPPRGATHRGHQRRISSRTPPPSPANDRARQARRRRWPARSRSAR